VNTSIPAIILAAGASRRLGQPKQLVRHRGETLLGRAIRLANDAGAVPVVAVLGAYYEIIRTSVELSGTIVALNELWEQGIASSIHAGLQALAQVEPNAVGVLILSCDQPRLTAGHLRALIETFIAQTEPSIAASAYAGVHGVPAIFPRSVFEALQALQGDKGARALLDRPAYPLISLPFEGGEVDIDQPSDLANLQ
jgi:molybdenum cofactor cytidylyltransferase